MRYHLVIVTKRGYALRRSFDAKCIHEAAGEHLREWGIRGTSFALVMRDASGRRYGFNDSASLRMHPCGMERCAASPE